MSSSLSRFAASFRRAMSRDSYRYSALPVTQRDQREQGRRSENSFAHAAERHARLVKMSLCGMALFAVLFLMVTLGKSAPTEGCEINGQCAHDVSHIWGQYSPFFSVPSPIDAAIPAGCNVTFAQVLSRHGARSPTKKKSKDYKAFLDRIRTTVTAYGAGYEFLESYEYGLGQDDLTPYGERQMMESGLAFYERYSELAEVSDPFVRAAGSGRVIASAENFTTGFYKVQGKDGASFFGDILVIPETPEFNNTLDHGACKAFEEGPASKVKHEKQTAWLNIFAPPITERLNAKLPGANITLSETIYMMDLCPYNTVASPNATLADFCRLFSLDEWRGYDYYESLDKWYGYGRGNPLGPSQGVGFGSELIARLTGQAVDDSTTTNSTLDSSPQTFPLDRALYADFSHDNTMSSIFAALGLYNETSDLPATRKVSPQEAGGFSSAWTVPFSARMYVEKLRCGAEEDEEYVRVLVNDRVNPLAACGGDELGRCKLGRFVDSLTFIRDGGLWNEC